MLDFTDRIEISNKSRVTLNRIRAKQKGTNKKPIHEIIMEEKIQMPHRFVFEEYSEGGWGKKVKTDRYIYNVLLKNLPEDKLEEAQMLVGDLLSVTRAVYEHINIEPKIHGFTNVTLESSQIEIEIQAQKVVDQFLIENYYGMSGEQRNKIYESNVVPFAQHLVIQENLDPDIANEHSFKTVLFENFLMKVNFPFIIKEKVEELLESDIYKEMFDQEQLLKHWDDFKTQSRDFARIVSTIV